MKRKRKKGSIILLGSIYGVVGQDTQIYINTGMSENIAYSVIKGGITNFTKQMASYYGKFNIRINCVAPGITNTDMLKKNHAKENLKIISNNLSLERIGEPKEIADLVLFLLSEKSSYITGQTIRIDGGM